ncbi:MAG TPA: amylo-alpha-1,6-glucosidase [Bacteroidota bacterium]|nr:amylo-alpha-1,6-glucosidase [Bacteroidota bacterium]
MRSCTLALVLLLVFSSCAPTEYHPTPRGRLHIDSLAIGVGPSPRAYMQSDRSGAFLSGNVGGRGEQAVRFSIGGQEILRNLKVNVAGTGLSGEVLDSATILPFRTRSFYKDGVTVDVLCLEGLPDVDTHGLVLNVQSRRPAPIVLKVSAAGRYQKTTSGGVGIWNGPGKLRLFVSALGDGSATPEGAAVARATSARFLLVACSHEMDGASLGSIGARVDTLLGQRRARMEDLLNASYILSSDDTLNRALQWIKLSMDALFVDRADTAAAAGLPWDGSIDGRDNAQSIAGMGLATGDYERTAAVIRTLARYQDLAQRSPTFGRLPDRVVDGRPQYGGADVAPWFARELYEYVVCTNDTAMVRSLYPTIRRSIDATLHGHTDRYNFLLHGPHETWMTALSRGNRAAEVEVSWYFEQLIGRFLASYLGDTAAINRWGDLAEQTAQNFSLEFTDTTTESVADHLLPDGQKVQEARPNAMMCMELLDEEAMRFGVTHMTATSLLLPQGVCTLAPSDPRYHVSPAGLAESRFNGPVWTWLTGPVTYILTRYDRQDVSYRLTKYLARVALSEDLAGTLPDMLLPAPEGERASLAAMAEFIRSVYQDYLGAHLDLAAGTIAIQPKIPSELSEVDFTVYAGRSPIDIEYRRRTQDTRVVLQASSLPKEMRVSLLWMMDDGSAWRGSFSLHAGVPAVISLSNDDALLYQGEQRGELEGKRKLKGFSQSKEAMNLAPSWFSTRSQ